MSILLKDNRRELLIVFSNPGYSGKSSNGRECAAAIVKSACRGDSYFTYPSRSKCFFLGRCFILMSQTGPAVWSLGFLQTPLAIKENKMYQTRCISSIRNVLSKFCESIGLNSHIYVHFNFSSSIQFKTSVIQNSHSSFAIW